MEFNKSKVYTALNADEVKIGSKGYFADTIHSLRSQAQTETIELMTLTKITPDYNMNRFCTDSVSFVYFYLVKEPREKKFRPYKNTEEMIEDFVKRYSQYNGSKGNDNPIYSPLIWIKNKDNIKCLISIFGTDYVETDINHFFLNDLLEDCTYLDGSPCGIEE